jgi:hypothetical protein
VLRGGGTPGKAHARYFDLRVGFMALSFPVLTFG